MEKHVQAFTSKINQKARKEGHCQPTSFQEEKKCDVFFFLFQVTSNFNDTTWPKIVEHPEDVEEEPDAVTLLSILLVGELTLFLLSHLPRFSYN